MSNDRAIEGPTNVLELLPYQRRLCDFLKKSDPDVWNWFSSNIHRADDVEKVKFDLLKSTYRVDRESQPELYLIADEVTDALGLRYPVTIYQAQNPEGLNAGLAFLPDEIHLVLHGPIAAKLNPTELRGLFGHEFTHFLLWRDWNSDLQIAWNLLDALCHDSRATPAQFASRRLFQLYTEIACDRGSLLITDDVLSVVSSLVKTETGVDEINPESYLKQADEIFAKGDLTTQQLTHPEAFVRARAIKLWADRDPKANDLIAQMIESKMELAELDLLAQELVTKWTRQVIDQLLWRTWFQTDAVMAHARLYFDDYEPISQRPAPYASGEDIRLETQSLRDYVSFLLLDFVTTARELDEAPLAAALVVAEPLGIKPRFMELARQELRLRKNQLEKVDQNKDSILRDADHSLPAEA